jgi:anti-sigma regulatory factor (Ser/Thr protein kinase)
MTAMSNPTPAHSPRCIELKIDSYAENLTPTRRAVEAFALGCGFDETSQGEIGLCVNEALANVLRHAYGGATGRPIAIRLENMPDGIRIAVRDWGKGLNPMTLAPREQDPLRPGGIGLICLRELMDEIDFHPQTDGMMLTMIRRKQASRRRGRRTRDCG